MDQEDAVLVLRTADYALKTELAHVIYVIMDFIFCQTTHAEFAV
jgi:hypothetical protein